MAPTLTSATARPRSPDSRTASDIGRAPERFATSILDAIRGTASTVDALCAQVIAGDPSLADRPVTFDVTGGTVSIDGPGDAGSVVSSVGDDR